MAMNSPRRPLDLDTPYSSLTASQAREMATSWVSGSAAWCKQGGENYIFGFPSLQAVVRVTSSLTRVRALEGYRVAQLLANRTDLPVLAPLDVKDTGNEVLALLPLCTEPLDLSLPERWVTGSLLASTLHDVPYSNLALERVRLPTGLQFSKRLEYLEASDHKLFSVIASRISSLTESITKVQVPSVLLHGDAGPHQFGRHRGQLLLFDLDTVGVGEREVDWAAYWAHTVISGDTAVFARAITHTSEVARNVAPCPKSTLQCN
jgi:hypothetical protein